jgi:O-acetyl-ADP-ribose deacetylase (regulator of RNase III)
VDPMSATLWVGLVLLAFGLLAYVLLVYRRSQNPDSNQHYGIAWFLVAIGGAIVLFWLFPGTPADGSVFGFKVGGVVAGLLVIWIAGMRFANDGERLDRRKAAIEQEERDANERLQQREEATRKLEAEAQRSTIKARNEMTRLQALTAGNQPEKTLDPGEILYVVNARPTDDVRVGLWTGDMMRVESVDIWVNSENTNMQMARYYEGSVSGMIRYYGAEREDGGAVRVGIDGKPKDPIAEELSAQVKQPSVMAASVYVTNAGELLHSNGVKKIFHVASVEGRILPGTTRGDYKQVPNIEDCVRKALERADSVEFATAPLTSIVFPLLGAGRGKGEVEETAKKLIPEAVTYLERAKGTRIKRVYFMALTASHKDLCTLVLDMLVTKGRLGKADGSSPAQQSIQSQSGSSGGAQTLA